MERGGGVLRGGEGCKWDQRVIHRVFACIYNPIKTNQQSAAIETNNNHDQHDDDSDNDDVFVVDDDDEVVTTVSSFALKFYSKLVGRARVQRTREKRKFTKI